MNLFQFPHSAPRYKGKIFLAALLLLLPSAAIYSAEGLRDKAIEVSGEAVLLRKADRVTLHAAIVTEASDASVALGENSEKMRKIIDSLAPLREAESGDYQTGSFSIAPIYSTPPKNRPEEWTARIVGYRVRNSLSVTLEEIEKSGEWIDELTQAGVNEVDRITFSLKNHERFGEEAIEAAITNGMKSAAVAAKAAGVRLGKVIKIDLQSAPSPSYRKEMFLLAAARSYSAPPIEAGEIEVRASLRLTYQIEYPLDSAL